MSTPVRWLVCGVAVALVTVAALALWQAVLGRPSPGDVFGSTLLMPLTSTFAAVAVALGLAPSHRLAAGGVALAVVAAVLLLPNLAGPLWPDAAIFGLSSLVGAGLAFLVLRGRGAAS